MFSSSSIQLNYNKYRHSHTSGNVNIKKIINTSNKKPYNYKFYVKLGENPFLETTKNNVIKYEKLLPWVSKHFSSHNSSSLRSYEFYDCIMELSNNTKFVFTIVSAKVTSKCNLIFYVNSNKMNNIFNADNSFELPLKSTLHNVKFFIFEKFNLEDNLNIINANNRLYGKEINLNDGILSTDASVKLLWNGGTIYIPSAKYPYQCVFPTIQQLEINLNNKFVAAYEKNIHDMIVFFHDKLNNDNYMDLLNNYKLTYAESQEKLLDLVEQYNIDESPSVRVQIVTPSGKIYADNKYPRSYGDVTNESTNIYNNPEISQAILVGIGGMARCMPTTKLLNVCIGTANKWGTTVLTRLIMEVHIN